MLLRSIDTNLIVALDALLHERNVTRAAKRIGLSQSSTSHALARLRAHFDDPLLLPAGRSLVLTERAQGLLGPVAVAIAELDRVFANVEKFDPGTSSRTFRIVGTDNLELYLLPALSALLAREAPSLSLRFHHLPKDWVEALVRGDADLKLGRKYPAPNLHSQDLVEERFVCVVRSRHPLRKNKLTWDDFSDLGHVAIAPTLSLGETFQSHIDEVLERRGRKRRVVMTVPHFLVAPFIVASSDLALIASERLVRTFDRTLGLRAIELPMRLSSFRLTQVWAERSHRDEGHAWLRSAVTRALVDV